jgi:hypothetical protein
MSTTRTLFRLLLGGCALLLVARCDGIGEQDFLCEVAVAHLTDCCPDFPHAQIDCATVNTGCAYSSLPALSSDESQCIMQLSCDDARRKGLCEKVPLLLPGIETCENPPPSCFAGGVYRAPVCP